MKISLTFLLLLVGSAWSATEPKDTVENAHLLYPFGEDVGDVKTPKEDDGASPPILISKPFKFYGKEHKLMYVNNNGVLSFDSPVQEYTPKSIPLGDGRAFAAVYWADANPVLGGNVFYRETHDPELLSKITNDINLYYPEKKFIAQWAFCATWHKVAYFGSRSKKTNTYQIVLTSGRDAAFAIMNFPHISWTTGSASGGNPMDGLGGSEAQIGFDGGNNKDYFSMPGSRSAAIINITETSNVNVPGRWVVQVSNFEVQGMSKEDWKKLKEEEEVRRAEDAAREAEEAALREAEEAALREAEELAAREAEEAAKEAEIPKEPESELPKEPEPEPEQEPEQEPEPEPQETPGTPEKVPPETEEEEDEDEEDCEW